MVYRLPTPVSPVYCATKVLAILSLYETNFYGMMESQGKRKSDVPKAEPSGLLPCSTDVTDGSALGFIDDEEPSVGVLLDQLAEILVAAYFHEKRNKR